MAEEDKEDKGMDITKLSRAIAEELKKLNQEKPPAPAVPGDMEKEPKPTWNCPECGEKLRGGEKHCPGCGVELEWEE
ncbi:hypothetical protein DRN58_09265 [Thermococci archaeon]|nr:MAG: hypothetical protein DRN58_09265 [Thermococci archaeon]